MAAMRKVADLQREEIESQAEVKSEFLSILANKHRLHILFLLSKSEYSLSELTRKLDGTTVALSRHLMILRENHIIVGRRCGKMVRYSLVCEKVARMIETVEELVPSAGFANDDRSAAGRGEKDTLKSDAQILATLFQNLYPPHLSRE